MSPSATPAAQETCQACLHTRRVTVHKILFHMNMSRAPHGVAPESTLCPCCDPLWSATGERPLPLPAAGAAPAVVGTGNAYPRTVAAAYPTATTAMESDYAAALAGKKKKGPLPSAVPVGVAGGGGASAFGRGGGSSMQATGVIVETPMCGCNVASKPLTVSKEGPNKGRRFFSCAKSRYVQCANENLVTSRLIFFICTNIQGWRMSVLPVGR